ncbi:ParA family protein [Novosphingobium flavum]|uniref:ParA family protein n=1 Tax=Novosphingobium aerophilum TaxID=2839843 RepID=A0A7X1F7T0_9SPHN|nr:ParA family protein [Novosphingobium aerophilum]MBC2651629.1 ParA family protein [Novosphingobium aerophilum]MBC2661459.1 ParA family protein [Novosphingobium aerophilum]
MKVVACYSCKGGVGKSTLAANLAWASACVSARRTLLWDLDPQGGGGFLLGVERRRDARAAALFEESTLDRHGIVPTAWPSLDVLPADPSLRGIDRLLDRLGKRKRLARLTGSLAEWYDRVILDCPPVVNALSDQIIRAADVVIVPLTASPLARRALDDVLDDLRRHHGRHAPVLPVFAMYDARRKLHLQAHAAEPDWPVVPMASVVEQMGVQGKPVGAFAPRSPAADAVRALWAGIERKLQG